jgi:hypothetical protein
MPDLLKQQPGTTIEYPFQELPISIQSRARKFFCDDEEPLLSIVSVNDYRNFVTIHILTPYRVDIMTNSRIERGFIRPENNVYKDNSILLFNLLFLSIEKPKRYELSLSFLSKHGGLNIHFYSEDLLEKFAKTILSIQRDWLEKRAH